MKSRLIYENGSDGRKLNWRVSIRGSSECACVAQLAEQRSPKPKVVGSIPITRALFLSELCQSIQKIGGIVMSKNVILSGIRASGSLHLGNYLGAIKNFVELSQDPKNTCLFFVADLHSLTDLPSPQDARRYQIEIVRLYLACGINLNHSFFYLQHTVGPELAGVAWFLNCHIGVGDLARLPTFKDKAGIRDEDEGKITFGGATMGLLSYPLLMASDIIAPDGTCVPVGEDQEPHLELTRMLVRRVNAFALKHGRKDLYPIFADVESPTSNVRVPGLDGSGKMSKSGQGGNAIGLLDDPKTVRESLRIAVTDPNRKRRKDSGNPDVCNIYTLYDQMGVSDDTLRWVRSGCQTATIGCVECKAKLAETINQLLEPIQQRYYELNDKDVHDILQNGTDFVRPLVRKTYDILCDLHGCTPAGEEKIE